ncbi:MAG: TonB-dependent receptor [Ferruginibacter sp.]
MKSCSVLLLMLTINLISAAQIKKGIVRGQLTDSMGKQQVSSATVSLINAKDSSLVTFTRTDSTGNFYFEQLALGKYSLSASQVNFYPQWKNFELTSNQAGIDLGNIIMKDKSLMNAVMVLSQRPPVVVNGDTLEFNAEAFKTKPNAVVEDMLKKMPGIQVDKDGNISVNGKKINRVLVNGKDFFNGDPKMATRNLPADAIDKVQVFDKLSDQVAFTGMDDGNAEKTINLKLKKDKKNAAFGKASIAAGTAGRYDGQFNINKFNNDQQLSVIGMSNNTNRQGFSIMDMLNFTGQTKKMMSGGGGRMIITSNNDDEFGLPVAGINNNKGINTTTATGFNYNDTWNKSTEVNASYFYNNLAINNEQLTNRQNILPGNNFNAVQSNSSNNKTIANRLNFSTDHRIDSFNSIKLTSLIGYQETDKSNNSSYNSFIPGGKKLNSGITNTSAGSNGYNTSNNLLLRHKFNKRGRTLSANLAMQYNDSRSNGKQYSINNFFVNDTIGKIDTLNQLIKINSITQSYGANISYTEPLGKRALLEFRANYNSNSGELDRKTYDYDQQSKKHDAVNNLLSNAFENNYNYAGAGVSLRVQKKKYGFSAGSNLQYSILKSHLKDSLFQIRQTAADILPLANFNYNFNRTKSLRIDYTTATNQPSVSQLQPVQNLGDPLNITQGNPSLKQSYSHNVSLQFFNGNPSKQKNLFVFVNYTATQHAIVNSDAINNGIRTTTYTNADGVYNINGNIDRGFKMKLLNSRIDLGVNINYNHSINFIDNNKNMTGNLSMTPRLSLNYNYKELLDVTAEVRLSYNEARYSLQPALNNNYWRQEYSIDASINLPAGFSISNDISYSAFTGRSNGYNTNIVLWNATASKQVLKNKKGEIKFSAFDLLNQNIGVDRNANINYVEDVQYKTLQRYFTAGFTYSLQKTLNGGPRAVIRTF